MAILASVIVVLFTITNILLNNTSFKKLYENIPIKAKKSKYSKQMGDYLNKIKFSGLGRFQSFLWILQAFIRV